MRGLFRRRLLTGRDGVGEVPPGTEVGPYRIVRACRGRGGMAKVFEVEVRPKYREAGMPRRLALKVAKPEHQASLVAEADFLRLFDHPNVVRIFPLPGFHRTVYAARAEFPFGLGWYYAMEYLDGGSLERTLTRTSTVTDLVRPAKRRGRRLNVGVALGIVRKIADALLHIHQQHIVNLDVKPANIMFRKRSGAFYRSSVLEAVLVDFGIARDLRYPRSGLLGVATPEYVSPEHASESNTRVSRADYRSDVFSLGVVFYEMLTGRMPFDNVARIVDPRFVPQSPRSLRRTVPKAVDEIVMHALAKHPNQRFQRMVDMCAALDRVSVTFDWPRARRYFATAVVAGGLVGGGLVVGSQLTSTDPEPTATPKPVTTATITSTATHTPTLIPTVRTAKPEVHTEPAATPMPTSTLMPTFTPTRTPIPVTPTSTPTPQP